MKSYKYNNNCLPTAIESCEVQEGETLEKKVAKMTENNEPLKADIGLLYTERKDGVLPGTNVRTDRWEVATDAMDKVSKSKVAKRENRFSIIEGGENASSTDANVAENNGGG